jgi:D-glycero-alpha-D-manno-heptose 1-phosphate guanylyltransferase
VRVQGRESSCFIADWSSYYCDAIACHFCKSGGRRSDSFVSPMSDARIDEAIILAGGKGTRLRSVVSDRPKPLAIVAGKPFIEWLLSDLASQGIRKAVLAVGFGADMIEDVLGDGTRYNLEIIYSRDRGTRGTGGAVRDAIEITESDEILVMNGDSYSPYDLPVLSRVHRQLGGMATLLLVQMVHESRFGAVTVDDVGRILAFKEKAKSRAGLLVNAGVYIMSRGITDFISGDGFVSLEHTIFPSLIGEGIGGAIGRGPLLDIGTPEAYSEASGLLPQLMGSKPLM